MYSLKRGQRAKSIDYSCDQSKARSEKRHFARDSDSMYMYVLGYPPKKFPPKKFPAIKFPKLTTWDRKFPSKKMLEYTTCAK